MIEFFYSGGFMMWPILICALLVLGLAVRAGRSLRGAGADLGSTLSATDAVLFWGGFGAVLGLLGTIVGISEMAGAIERLGEVSAATVWSGVKVTLVTSMAGLLTLLFALLLWLALRGARSRRLDPARRAA